MPLLATCAYASVTSNLGPCTIFSTRTISCPYGRVNRPWELIAGVVTSGYRPRTAPLQTHNASVTGILCRCCSRGHIRLRAPYDLTRLHTYVWLNNSQDSTGSPCDACMSTVRAPHGNLQCFPFPTGPVRDQQGCRTVPLRTRKGIDTTIIARNPARHRIWLYGPVRAVHGLFTISKPVRGP